MQLGMIGLGRMGANMVRRLLRGGHECVVYDRHGEAMRTLAQEGATPSSSLADLVAKLQTPRAVWLMIPAALVDMTLAELTPLLHQGDILIDGGNSYYVDDLRRAKELAAWGLHYVDVGTSGGIWGLERGYCLMIGGAPPAVGHLEPIFRTLSAGPAMVPRTPGRIPAASTAEHGYLHCGPSGAGHFVKMIHNGIEYGLMAAFAEGFNILHQANVGKRDHAADAETSPLRHPEHYQYDFPLPEIAEVWRRGSVISSWLLDLAAQVLSQDANLEAYSGHVADSGEGRWTVQAAIEEGTPAPVLSAALYQRFASRGEDAFAAKLLSALRHAFGGHVEKPQHVQR
jgi:6-phosphogluconate dehydrogenase